MSETTDAQVRVYELLAILPTSLKEKDLAAAQEEFRAIVAKAKGEIFVDEIWERRPLAYKIRGEDQGIYYVLNFRMEPSKLIALSKAMRLETKSIRVFVTRMPDDYTYASFVQEEKAAAEHQAEIAPGLAAKKRGGRPAPRIMKDAPRPDTRKTPTTVDSSKLDSVLKDIDKKAI